MAAHPRLQVSLSQEPLRNSASTSSMTMLHCHLQGSLCQIAKARHPLLVNLTKQVRHSGRSVSFTSHASRSAMNLHKPKCSDLASSNTARISFPTPCPMWRLRHLKPAGQEFLKLVKARGLASNHDMCLIIAVHSPCIKRPRLRVIQWICCSTSQRSVSRLTDERPLASLLAP